MAWVFFSSSLFSKYEIRVFITFRFPNLQNICCLNFPILFRQSELHSLVTTKSNYWHTVIKMLWFLVMQKNNKFFQKIARLLQLTCTYVSKTSTPWVLLFQTATVCFTTTCGKVSRNFCWTFQLYHCSFLFCFDD